MSAAQIWAGTTFGNGWMHKHLIRSLRFIDVRFHYVFAAVFVIPVCLLVTPGTRHQFSFLHRRLGFGIFKSMCLTYVNFCKFSQVVLDRFAMYAGQHIDVDVIGQESFSRLASAPEGFVILSSHIGNYELAGYSLVSDRKPIHAVVYAGEKASIMEGRSDMFARTRNLMIPVREDMSHLFEIDGALSDGDIVSMPADRGVNGGRTVRHGFLGADASFPQGPFSVAAMRGLDVLAVNVLKDKSKHYNIHVTQLQYDRTKPRKEQVAQLCGAYVAELERIIKIYPTQWYNYFDFWK